MKFGAVGNAPHVMKTETRVVLTRKAANEVAVGDLVHLPAMLTEAPFMVLAIHQRNELLGIALKGYGEVRFHPDQPVNCREGSW